MCGIYTSGNIKGLWHLAEFHFLDYFPGLCPVEIVSKIRNELDHGNTITLSTEVLQNNAIT